MRKLYGSRNVNLLPIFTFIRHCVKYGRGLIIAMN